MKKILIMIALMAISINSFAQWNFGVRAYGLGSNVNNGFYQLLQNEYNVTRPGFGAGLFAEYDNLFSPNGAGIRGEVLINTLGEKARYSNQKSSSIRTVYLDIPVLAQYKVAHDRLAFVAGPQFGFCLGCKEIFRNGKDRQTEKWTNKEYNMFDFSIAFGLSYKVVGGLGIEARYNLGITDVYTNFGEPTGKNRWLSLGLSYTI